MMLPVHRTWFLLVSTGKTPVCRLQKSFQPIDMGNIPLHQPYTVYQATSNPITEVLVLIQTAFTVSDGVLI